MEFYYKILKVSDTGHRAVECTVSGGGITATGVSYRQKDMESSKTIARNHALASWRFQLAETMTETITTTHASECHTRRGGVGEYIKPECTEVVTDATGRIILKGALVQLGTDPAYHRVWRVSGCQVWLTEKHNWVHPSHVRVIW